MLSERYLIPADDITVLHLMLTGRPQVQADDITVFHLMLTGMHQVQADDIHSVISLCDHSVISL